MPADRFFYDAPLHEGETLHMTGEELKHLVVMRLRAGEPLELVNGRGELAKAVLQAVDKKGADLQVEEVKRAEKPFRLILAQALTKQPKLEWIVEKATELGASEIWLFPGEKSEREKLSEHQLERLRHLTIAAMKQCGRLYLPKIVQQPELKLWGDLANDHQLLLADLIATAPYLWEQKIGNSKSAILLIGPESGFSEAERKTALTTLGARPVRLHENILRAETASLTALALLYSLLPR